MHYINKLYNFDYLHDLYTRRIYLANERNTAKTEEGGERLQGRHQDGRRGINPVKNIHVKLENKSRQKHPCQIGE